MKAYTAKEVSKLLGLSVGQIRSYARAGFLEPERGPRGEYRLSFQDLVLLRTAKGLLEARVPPRRVRAALVSLKEQMPSGRPLSAIQIQAEGDQVVVRQGNSLWNPESGQGRFNFDVSELTRQVAPHGRKVVERVIESGRHMGADDWYALGNDLETASPEQAREAYRLALDRDPHHVETRVNLGRLLHEEGKLHAAEAHYRLALAASPANITALFNLGVCLEDMGRTEDAIGTYLLTIEADPDCADAYYNVARLYESLGDAATALQHLKTYRTLTEG